MAISNGVKVQMHYTLTVDGETVDSSQRNKPLSFVQGEHKIIAGLEKQLAGLKAGDSKKVAVPPEDAYGPRREEGIQTLPSSTFSDPNTLKIGGLVQGSVDGNPFRARVMEIGKDTITLDLNHPLAGKTLEFEIEIVSVDPTS